MAPKVIYPHNCPPRAFPKSLKVLAPAGGYPSPKSILNARKKLANKNLLPISFLETTFGAYLNRQVISCGSGKEALYWIFQAISKHAKYSKKPVVLVSAYTCPDIAAVALRANLIVHPVNINHATLEMDITSVSPDILKQTCAVVLSNLYGLIDPIAEWKDLSKMYEFVIIDDACQAMLSIDSKEHIGCRDDTYGVISFGRGKALCSIGGGCIIVPREDCLGLAKIMQERVRGDKISSVGIVYLMLCWLFEKPAFYRIASSMPFLRLGQTRFDVGFKIGDMTNAQVLAAIAQLDNIQRTVKTLTTNTARLSSLLRNCNVIQPFLDREIEHESQMVLIRYPIIFRTKKERDIVATILMREGLGVSFSYPAILKSYLGDKTREHGPNLLTLPVHRYVTEADMIKSYEIIRASIH
jgi:perosamine synthetase